MKVTDNKTIHTTELLSGVAVTVTGIFLLLVGLDVFPFSAQRCWLIAVFSCLFVISLIVAILQKNSIGVAFSWIFGMLIVAQLFIMLGFSVRNIYPVYIIALPLGIANGATFANFPSKVIIVCFGIVGVGLLLFLESTTLLSVAVVLPIIAIYLGSIGILYALSKLVKTKKSDDK